MTRYQGDCQINLNRAYENEGRDFVDAWLETQPNRLGEAFRQRLCRRTAGHPLFTVELLRDMQERGDLVQDEQDRWIEAPHLDWSSLPAKVKGVIEKRIGRLDAELRQALTIASVEGEEFTAEVVARVQGVAARGLVRRLSEEVDKQHRLVDGQGSQRLRQQRLSSYRFRHNLFQKYLYDSLDEMERAYLHEDIGNALEALYEEETDEIAVQLARHFEEAGMTQKAAGYLHQAGNKAARVSAYEEAIAHFEKGLVLLEQLPEIPERYQQELNLQIGLGNPLLATKGYGASEVKQVYDRASELSQQLGKTNEIFFSMLYGFWVSHIGRGEFQKAHEIAEQHLSLAQQYQASVFLLVTHRMLGTSLFFLGEFVPAREHLENSVSLYDPLHHSPTYLLGQDHGVSSLSYLAQTLWHLGYPDQALAKSQEALSSRVIASRQPGFRSGLW